MSLVNKETQKDKSFKDKWENNPDLAFADTQDENSEILHWILTRNGYRNLSHWRDRLSGTKRILDAGCGNGRITALLSSLASSDAEVVGIDKNSASVAEKNLGSIGQISIHQADLLGDLSSLGQFDYVYCQEVLHHTSNPREAFSNLAGLLSDEGEIAIYVYKQKAPVREFVDEYVREQLKSSNYADATRHSRQIALFGKALSELNQKVTVPAVDVLEIEAGEYDVQRLIYHFFFKCFWNGRLSESENTACNYDWYHPQIATKHRLEEVEEWFEENGLEVKHRHVDHYGITVSGIRRG